MRAPPHRPRLYRALLVVAAAALLSGCPRTPEAGGPPPPKPVPLPVRIAHITHEARSLLRTQAKLLWESWAHGKDVDVAGTYKGHAKLFSKASIALVKKAEARAKSPAKRRALRYLESYLVGEYVSAAVAPLESKVANVEASAIIEVDGDEVPYRDLGRLLASEPDAKRRRALSAAAVPVLDQLNPILEKKEARSRAVAKALGYAGYVAMSSRLRNTDLDALGKLAEAVLAQTKEPYRKAMDRVAKRDLGYGLDQVRRPDVARLFKDPGAAADFPKDQMIPRLKHTLAGMGLSYDAGGHILVDDASTPRKNPRAVCFAIDVPTDIRLSIKPTGGAGDYASLFHEMGHAQAFAHTKTKVFAFQQLGSNAVTEAYAFLFEDLVGNPEWVAANTPMKPDAVRHFAEMRALEKLYMVRRYAAKVLFELAWHRGGNGGVDPEALYGRLLSRAYQFPLDDADRKRWLVDHDDFFYSADYLRAWLLEAKLEQWLVARHGKQWFADKGTGTDLEGLWEDGTRWTADEIASRLGKKGLDPAPLVDTLDSRLAQGMATSAAVR